jgi:hypothetical protein
MVLKTNAGEMEQIAQKFDAIRADLSELTGLIKSIAEERRKEIENRAGALVGELGEQGRKLAEDLGDRGRKLVSDAQGQIYNSYDELERTVKRNPLTAMLVVLGLGFLVGSLSRHR